MEYTVVEIKSKKGLKQFINFPKKLYKGCPYWIPPLDFDEMNTLAWDINPAFKYCVARYWMVFQNQQPVGRIAGIINHKSNEIWNEKKIRFGWFDCINEPKVAAMLIKLVEDWGKESGLTSIHGPLGFTDMDKEGMLIDYFETINTIATLYNYPYYPILLKALGFEKDADWIQFEIPIPDQVPERIKTFSEIITKKYNLRVLEIKKTKELLAYAPEMFEVLNTAYSHLYGFVQLTPQQIEAYIKQYFSFIRKDYICFILDQYDHVVGFAIAFPSLSKAFIKAKGKLFPLGFLHIIRAIKSKNDTLDMYLIGIRPDFQNKGLTAIIFNHIAGSCIKNGIKRAITNPQLVNNHRVVQLWADYNYRQIALRTCFNKPIG